VAIEPEVPAETGAAFPASTQPAKPSSSDTQLAFG